ncbi:E3 ubiquitin-ligase RNF130-like [Brachionus plicatilis]|uniref:E3 ubiquitin-ligase RNF130-like n=1 Tax=Brachionus plicatilis TaxID=10195 RepID=A0A3M7RTM6_BRAPC|nr:E3 ubiquitin-ligase RNF130-like [Brachionus plicatilis]
MIFYLIFFLVFQVSNGEQFCFAKVTLTNKHDDYYQNLHLSALYSVHSQTSKIHGRLVLAKSFSLVNRSQVVSQGCSSYLNEPVTYNYISLIDQGGCSFDQKIENAIRSNALALILISKNSQIFKIRGSKYNQLVVVMISNEMGTKLKALLDTDDINVSIDPKNCENREFYIETELNYQRFSYVSIMFIIIGNLCLLILLGGSCAIFYLVQKTRLIEERERTKRLIERLTKRAISKMKFKKIKANDRELNDVCVICMENYNINDSIRILPCSHIFHREEIDQWMTENKTCPICKIDILRYHGIEIETRSNVFFSILQRLKLIRSNEEIAEAILAHQNSQNDAIYTIHNTSISPSFFSTGIPNNSFINSVEQRSMVYAEFQRNHLKSYSLDDIDEINTNTRLTFFGEKMAQHAPENNCKKIVQEDEEPNERDREKSTKSEPVKEQADTNSSEKIHKFENEIRL